MSGPRLRRLIAIPVLSAYIAFGCVPRAASARDAPVAAPSARACDVAGAAAARRAAERASRRRDFVAGAREFLAAARDLDACPAASAAFVAADALVEAAALLAHTGDYLPALSAVQRARRRLEAVIARDAAGAVRARALLAEVDELGLAIETIAQASM